MDTKQTAAAQDFGAEHAALKAELEQARIQHAATMQQARNKKAVERRRELSARMNQIAQQMRAIRNAK